MENKKVESSKVVLHDTGNIDTRQGPDSPPPPIRKEQMNGKFPEVVTEVSVRIKVRETIQRLKENNNIHLAEYYEDFRYLWQMSRYASNDSLRKMVIATYVSEDFFSVFLKLWKIQETLNCFDAKYISLWKNLRSAISVIWNSCDSSSVLCQQISESPLLAKFAALLDGFSKCPDFIDNEKKLYFVKSLLGILHNTVSKYEDAKFCLRNHNGVQILQNCLILDHPMLKAKSLITLSYIVDEQENEVINATADTICFIINVLRDSLASATNFSSKFGMGAVEVTEGLNNIAFNDSNKVKIVQGGAIPLLVKMMSNNRNCQYYAVMLLWTLAFNQANRKAIICEPGCEEGLNILVNCKDKTLSHAARGALWEINSNEEQSISKEVEADCPHIMISYQWDVQPVMLKVKERLKQSGFKVWMDVEHMSGSTLEAMALAVEKSVVVLICLSEKYKASPSCRTEAEYIYRLRKDIIPLRVQKKYYPDGWLGMMVGTRLYFDFSEEVHFDYQINKLTKELGNRGMVSTTNREIFTEMAVPKLYTRENSIQMKGQAISYWTCKQVSDWLESIELSSYKQW
ncbi:hypothetical protein SNE40_010174 [Patella caerulea]|uniref:ADP-ribosyl cyclase/cyclic ADP-ribose hydrolase n=1 Tax=Patella caerulea TaxID=87958 RepID=A0AAN8JTN5_PATCE